MFQWVQCCDVKIFTLCHNSDNSYLLLSGSSRQHVSTANWNIVDFYLSNNKAPWLWDTLHMINKTNHHRLFQFMVIYNTYQSNNTCSFILFQIANIRTCLTNVYKLSTIGAKSNLVTIPLVWYPAAETAVMALVFPLRLAWHWL